MIRWSPARPVAVVLLVAAVLVSVSACAPADMRTIIVNQQMSVVLVNLAAAPAETGIDPGDPRIPRAGAAIADLLGHPIRYEIDAALARRFGKDLHDRFVAAMEATLDGLGASRKRTPDAFAYAGPALRTIAIEYGPAAQAPAPALDMKTGVLRVVLTPEADGLLGGYEIVDTFEASLEASTAARFASRAPESIPAGEQRAYVGYVVRHHPPQGSRGAAGRAADAAARIAALVRVYDRVADPSLRADIRIGLLDLGEAIEHAVTGTDADARAAAEPVRGAFIAWANARAEEWSLRDQRGVIELFFSRDAARDDRFGRGFDVVRFARPIVAAFAHATPPAETQGNGNVRVVRYGTAGDSDHVVDVVVCPYEEERGSSRMGQRYVCDGVLYAGIFSAPDGARRLASWILELGADTFTQSAVLNVMALRGPASALDVVEAVMAGESTPRASVAALHAIAGYGGWRRRDASPALDVDGLVARLLGWYRARPRLRGAILYALTGVGREAEPKIAWGHLAQLLGAPLTADEYGAFLDQSPHALAAVDLLTKGLGPGWSRARVVIPRFQRLLEQRAGDDDTERQYLSERLVRSFCEGGTLADVKAFQVFAQSRLEAYPSEQRYFRSIAQAAPGELCDANSPAVVNAGSGRSPVLFGN